MGVVRRSVCHGLLALVTAASCAGDLALPDGSRDAPGSEHWLLPDGPTYPDGATADAAPTLDLAPTVDIAPQPDAGPPTGGPCPCQAPLLCAASACRAPCVPPTDPCMAVSNCPSTHACVVMTNLPNTAVCLPGLGSGQPCSPAVYCAVNLVCGSVNSGPYSCLPVCTQTGASCGTSGGTCLGSTGCLFCSLP